MEFIPCSHVGHIFRKYSPYNWTSEVVNHEDISLYNNERVAEVWLDEYKEIFYAGEKKVITMEYTQRLSDNCFLCTTVALRKTSYLYEEGRGVYGGGVGESKRKEKTGIPILISNSPVSKTILLLLTG